MKLSYLKSKDRRHRLAHSCLALLIVTSAAAALVLPGYTGLPAANAANEEDAVMSFADSEDNDGLLASFDFNDGTDRLKDLSENGTIATIVDDDKIIGTENGNNYLDLTKSDAYLSLPGSTLNGLDEMTVEMRVKTKDTNANWAFFAAPDGYNPGANPTYLGVLLNTQIKVERFAGGRGVPGEDGIGEYDKFFGTWKVDDWYTIRIAFGKDSTTLYIDGEEVMSQDNEYSLEDCLGTDGVLWFGHAPWTDVDPNGEYFNGCIDDISIWNTADPELLTDGNLVVSLDFEGEENDILADKSGKDCNADLVGGTVDTPDLFQPESSGNTYLDLSDRNAYLSLTDKDGKGVLNGLQEMTVEMRVLTKDTNANWAFFAAPNEETTGEFPTYLGVLLNSRTKVERFAKGRGWNDNFYGTWAPDKWQTIRVVFKISSTILYVGNETIELGTMYSLKDCLGKDGVLWFGHSSWGNGEYFNGCIDYIKIWDHAIYDPIDEEQFIVGESRVSEPTNTTVNMFDYWITSPDANDYLALDGGNRDSLLEGINKDHLFLFAGETIYDDNSGSPSETEIGFWNRFRGFEDDSVWNTITQGIVKNNLVNGYPVLALDRLDDTYKPTNGKLSELWTAANRTESLAYLFDPDQNGGSKVSYPNVKGLFQMNGDGYYEFNSWDAFAELNVEQEGGAKTSSPEGNRITLYDVPWGWGTADEDRGQFFPFNDWSNMFFIDPVTGKLEQAHKNYSTTVEEDGKEKQINIEGAIGQTTTDESPNHYFGMTVETKFQQPVDGMIESDPMTFTFSGDDDVWVFIDDVLVADLGGIHGWTDFTIDFATGEIKFADSNKNTYLDDMFKKAKEAEADPTDALRVSGGDPTDGWKEIDGGHKIFPDYSIHTLKFFYLERGNQYSNCHITFNFQKLPEKTETKPAAGETVKPGDTIDYEIKWGNYTNDIATLTYTDMLDENVDFVSASCGGITLEAQKDEEGSVISASTGNNGDVIIEYDKGTRTVTWTLKEAEPGADVTAGLTVEVNENIENGDIILNWADVTNEKVRDQNGELIKHTTEIIKNPVVDLDIVKKQSVNGGGYTTDKLTVKEGDKVTYELTVEVKGTTDEVLEYYGLEKLKSIVLEDIVAEDMIPVGSTEGQCSLSDPVSIQPAPYEIINYDNITQIIKWELGDIAVDTTITLSYTVTVPHVEEDTAWKNIAYAVSDYMKNGQPGYPGSPANPRPWEPSNEVEIEDPVGNLKISKTVQDSHGYAPDTEFEFTVKFYYDDSDPSASSKESNELSVSYPYYDADGEKLGTVGSGDKVKLKDGGSIIIKGLPAEAFFTVTETESAYYNAGRNALVRSGRIEGDGKTVSVEFVNVYNAGELVLTVSKEVAGRPWNSTEKFTFELSSDKDHSEDEDGVIMPDSLTVEVSEGKKTAAFDAIKFNALSIGKTYLFYVSEVKDGAASDLVCDPAEYEVSVTVYGPENGDENGELIVAASYTVKETINGEKDTDGKYNIAIPFTNQAHISTSIPVTKKIENGDWTEGDSFDFTISSVVASPDYKNTGTVVYPTDPINIAYSDTSKTKEFVGIEFYSTGTYEFVITEAPPEDDSGNLRYDGAHTVVVKVGVNETDGQLEIKSVTVDNAYDIIDDDDGVVFTNTYEEDQVYNADVNLSVPIEKKLEGWKDEVFEFTIELIADTTGTMSGFKMDPITLGKNDSTGSFKLEFKSNGSDKSCYVFEISETKNSEYGDIIYADPYMLTVEVTDDMQGKMTVECYIGEDKSPIDLDRNSLVFVNKYKSEPPSGAGTPAAPPAKEDDTTDPPSTEAVTTEPPVTEPASTPETYPPATSDDYFNLNDDGLPEGDKNLQTGVSFGGTVYVAVGTLLLSAAALAVGKRRYSKKGK